MSLKDHLDKGVDVGRERSPRGHGLEAVDHDHILLNNANTMPTEHRRYQIRLAQRRYRSRKEEKISMLSEQTAQLKSVLSQLRQSILGLKSTATILSEAGRAEEAAVLMQCATAQMLLKIDDALNGSHGTDTYTESGGVHSASWIHPSDSTSSPKIMSPLGYSLMSDVAQVPDASAHPTNDTIENAPEL
ncbi:hypothetical protein APSETT444_010448 [Aspergillus pseudonomiae]